MLAPKETMDSKIMEISVAQFGAERHANNAKMGNANNVTSAFSKLMKPESTPERLSELFEKLNLKGIEDWSETEQAEVHELMTEFQHLFALSDLELGCTSLVKCRINVNNPVPFKERYMSCISETTCFPANCVEPTHLDSLLVGRECV